MRAALLALPLLLAILVPGCTGPHDNPTFRLSGSFTSDRTEEDLDDFQDTVERYSDDVAILESFPEQFVISGIVGGCEQLRVDLDAKPYIASVSACSEERATTNGDEATSSDV